MTYIKTKCFVDCERLRENTAKFNFEDNTLKLGKANSSREQLKRISLMLATDLKNFAETLATLKILLQRKFILTCKTINKTKRKKFKLLPCLF